MNLNGAKTTQVAAAVRATGDYPERAGELSCQVSSLMIFTSIDFLQCLTLFAFSGPLLLMSLHCIYNSCVLITLIWCSSHEQYYLKTGTCKFGASCRFNHPKHGGGSLGQAPLNIYGLPLRPVWLFFNLMQLMANCAIVKSHITFYRVRKNAPTI